MRPYLQSAVIRGGNHPPGVGLKAADDAGVAFGRFPIERGQTVARRQAPEFDATVQRARDNTLVVERQARHGVLMAAQRGHAAAVVGQAPHFDRLVGRTADQVAFAKLQAKHVVDVAV